MPAIKVWGVGYSTPPPPPLLPSLTAVSKDDIYIGLYILFLQRLDTEKSLHNKVFILMGWGGGGGGLLWFEVAMTLLCKKTSEREPSNQWTNQPTIRDHGHLQRFMCGHQTTPAFITPATRVTMLLAGKGLSFPRVQMLSATAVLALSCCWRSQLSCSQFLLEATSVLALSCCQT